MHCVKVFLLCLISATNLNCSQTYNPPYTSGWSNNNTCALNQICEFTGNFSQANLDNISLFYLYDEMNDCILFSPNQNFEKDFEVQSMKLPDLPYSADVIGTAKPRPITPYLQSDFCADKSYIIDIESHTETIILTHIR